VRLADDAERDAAARLLLPARPTDRRLRRRIGPVRRSDEAQNVLAEELKSPHSLFQGERVALGAVGQGRNSLGHEAWIVEYKTASPGKRLCVMLWAENSPFRTTITYEIDTCRPNEPRPLESEA
jgi:hypothetical protein